MKEMIKRIREEKGGFTLAELLIVVAIILVLVAIAVPVFTGAMDKANDAVKKSSISSVKHTAASAIMLDTETYGDAQGNLVGPWTATAVTDDQGNIEKIEITSGAPAKEEATKDEATGKYTVVAKITATEVTDKTTKPQP